MVFSSTLFLFLFLPITLIGYYLAKGRFRNYWLLLASLVFFGWSQPKYVWIIVLNILINYTGARLIDRSHRLRKLLLTVVITANIAILFYFKYFDFVIQTVNAIFGTGFDLKNIVLPIGISFFTFQGMSYVIDVYRGDVPVQTSLLKVGLYIMLFPQLIAGPIVRYKDISLEIDDRRTTLEDFSRGIERFIIGLGKKAIIANTVAQTADAIWANGATGNTWIIAWAGCIAYTLQIYFDFSGYSDMAIGLGRMFGFHFIENFNLPYISKSITEFWRRWHISLSSWFRDYVYIPLGGNQKNVYLNLSIVFLLTGIWHGAAIHFVIWGLWNGAFILIERVLGVGRRREGGAPDERLSLPKRFLCHIYTLLIVALGWVLFRAPSTKDALQYVASMFGIVRPTRVGYTVFWYLDRWTITVMLLGALFSTSLPSRMAGVIRRHTNETVFTIGKYALLLLLLYMAMIRIVSGTYNPFIYFQF